MKGNVDVVEIEKKKTLILKKYRGIENENATVGEIVVIENVVIENVEDHLGVETVIVIMNANVTAEKGTEIVAKGLYTLMFFFLLTVLIAFIL